MAKYQGLAALLSSFALLGACPKQPFKQQFKAETIALVRVKGHLSKKTNYFYGLQLQIIKFYKGSIARSQVRAFLPGAEPSLPIKRYKYDTTLVVSMHKGANGRFILAKCFDQSALLEQKGYVYGCLKPGCEKLPYEQKMPFRGFERWLAKQLKK